MDKQQVYEEMTNRLAMMAEKDQWLMKFQPADWRKVRELDDWLVQYRTDDRVGLQQYRRNCERLEKYYTETEEERQARAPKQSTYYGSTMDWPRSDFPPFPRDVPRN